ncbi:hypothetical protein [Pelagimonas varians]|uniref:Uncharacterized protein n=1 Tax=Pelagimonas varians TaxID=696760 RepID=A0A238KBX1_9RHOB|nr:hypothetical protein [Pelagimonas varians]PYG30048.1 hypothetical protein C8N36_107215 [Pelagimonas varians]SMX40339.1 hypothetical protein PEV8663_01981 [Pelagimonas varians]
MGQGNHKSRGGWYELREGAQFTLSRHLPARFDVQAEAVFPPALRGRLARQIRQDLWRELRGLRGFSPVILVSTTEEGMTVTAGGQFLVPGSVPKNLSNRIQSLLDSPAHRARWLKWAKRRAT